MMQQGPTVEVCPKEERVGCKDQMMSAKLRSTRPKEKIA
jgi:hypothetical protein